jgi:hypothetical protein
MLNAEREMRPALTADEWARVVGYRRSDDDLIRHEIMRRNERRDMAGVIALANQVLPDDHTGKITAEDVGVDRARHFASPTR